MKSYSRTMILAAVSLMLCSSLNSCAKAPEKPEKEPEPSEYPDRSIYSDAIFRMDEVPADEPSSDIAFREARLSSRVSEFYASLDNAIASGNISGWLQDYYDEYSSEVKAAEPYTVLILQVMDEKKYADALKPYIVDILRENIPVNIETFRTESEKDKAAGKDGRIHDLNTKRLGTETSRRIRCRIRSVSQELHRREYRKSGELLSGELRYDRL